MINWKYIVLIVAIIGVLAFLLIWNRRKSLSFDFDLGGNIANILNGVQGRYAMEQARINSDAARGLGFYVDVPLTTIIKNNKAGATVLKNIIGSLSYNGEPIIQTKADSQVLQNVAVAGRGSTPITDNVQLLVNPSSIKFLTELVQGKKPKVNYNFATTIAGKPYSFTNVSQVDTENAPQRIVAQQPVSNELYTADGTPVNADPNQKKKTCPIPCLVPYGSGTYTCSRYCFE